MLASQPAIADDAGGVDAEERIAASWQHDPLSHDQDVLAMLVQTSYVPYHVASDPEIALAAEPDPEARVPALRPKLRPAGFAQMAAAPVAPASLRGASALECIAVAIYHEARDQDESGQRAVASVILQRAAVEHRWGDTPCDVVVPVQFSFMTSRYGYPPIKELEAWAKAWRIAREVMNTGPLPELNGADHYHTTEVAPYWAPKMVKIAQLGDHIFYVDPASS